MFGAPYQKGPIVADTALTVAKVANLLSSFDWHMFSGLEKTELGVLMGAPIEVLGAQGNGSSLLVGFSHPDGSAARIIDPALGTTCSRPDGSAGLFLGHPCQFTHPSGDPSIIRVHGNDERITVLRFNQQPATLFGLA